MSPSFASSIVARVPRSTLRSLKGALATGVVLTYHRIGAADDDPWGLAVSPERFAAHMDVIARCARPAPLAELDRTRRRRERRLAVAVTFDDGYVDNLDVALPIVERAGVPITVFVTTGFIGSAVEPWWDRLATVLLGSGSRPYDHIDVGDRRIGPISHVDTRPAAGGDPAASPVGSRLWAYHEVWRCLRPLPEPERQELLAGIAAQVGVVGTTRESCRTVTPAELARLAASSLVEIGAHTVTHPALAGVDAQQQFEEIRESRRILEDALERPVRSFSYPYGDYSQTSVDAVRRAGFARAVTCDELAVWRGTDSHRIGRFGVGDWDADRFETELRGWFRA